MCKRTNHKNGEVSVRITKDTLEKLSALCSLIRGHDDELNAFVRAAGGIAQRKYRVRPADSDFAAERHVFCPR